MAKQLDLDRLCQDFEDCLGWPYVSPGGTGKDCSSSGIDCSGMFVRAYKLQGSTIYHGSNAIWRKHLSAKGKLTSASQLRKGMAVFKWNERTPSKYDDDEGDFQHIGLVTSVHPLRIVHASTEGKRVVKVDTRYSSRWRYWGWLDALPLPDELAGASVFPAAGTKVSAEAALPATLRRGSRGNAVVTLQNLLRGRGYELEPDGIFGYMTQNAVKSFQAANGLANDGIVGRLTWSALMKQPVQGRRLQ